MALTAPSGGGFIPEVTDAMESSRAPNVGAVICVESEALDRFGPVLRHLFVGLVEQAVPLRLVSSDPRIQALCLGPVQAVLYPSLHWPTAGRRIERMLDALSPQPPTVVHAMSRASYRLATMIADEFDADLILEASSLTDCDAAYAGPRETPARYHAVSQALASILENQVRVASEFIEVIPPGVPVSSRVACFSQPHRVPTLLCTSRLARGSGIDRLIGVMELLTGRGHEVQLFLLADGPSESALRRQVRARDLSGCVTFAPRLDDLTPALLGADIFIRPSQDAEFSADSLQAMAAGVAVIAQINSACDHLRPGETAMVCSNTTAEALAELVEAFLRDRSEAGRIAASGMEYVRRHHGVSAMAERTASAYRKLALTGTTFAMRG